MVFSGFRPGGNRLVWPTDKKIKGLQIQRKMAEEASTALAYINWDWDGWIKPEIDLAVDGEGANLVKFYSGIKAVLDGDITQATHDAQAREFIEYAASKGVDVYWCPHFLSENGPANDPDTLAQIVNTAAILAAYPHVVAMDCSNEVVDYAVQAAVQADVYAACKAVAPSLPLTVSIGINYPSWFGRDDQIFSLFYPYVDFWDFHLYYGFNNDPNGGNAVPTDVDIFRRSPYYKPWLQGETGMGLLAGQAAQSSRWASLGVMSAEPDCMGSIGYTTQDCIVGSDYGIWTNDSPPERRGWIGDEFAGWPERR